MLKKSLTFCFAFSFIWMISAGTQQQIELTMDESKDLSHAFANWHQKDSSQLLEKLASEIQNRQLKIILAPGFISGLGRLSHQRNLAVFAKALSRTGLERGVDYDFAPFNTFQGIDYNARKLKSMVKSTYENEGRKVLIVGHSMGGLHTENMLLQYPKTQKMVDRYVGLQNPWKGSAIADKMENFLPTKIFMHNFLKGLSRPKNIENLKSAAHTLEDLEIAKRSEFYQEHVEEMAAIRKIPSLQYVTSIPRGEENLRRRIGIRPLFSNLASLFKYLQNKQESDYFVALASQIRDEDMYFVYDEGDHLALVMNNQINDKEMQVQKLATLILMSFKLP